MFKKSIIISIFLLFLISITNAQEVVVEKMVFCTAIEDRQPTNIDTVFTSNVERVYCFTKIGSSADTTSITHVWYYDNEEKARVQLSVKAKTWRTWSSKTIWKTWKANGELMLNQQQEM